MNWMKRLWAWLRRRRAPVEPAPVPFDDRWRRVPFHSRPPLPKSPQQTVTLGQCMVYHHLDIRAATADEEETLSLAVAAIALRELTASSGDCAPPAEVVSGGGGDFGGGGASGEWDAPTDEAPAASEPPPPAEPSPAASPSPDSD